MKFRLTVLILTSTLFMVKAQKDFSRSDTSWKSFYRESSPKINDLVHTKLDVKFDFANSYMYGKAWLKLKPHFYPTDSLTLDAKGMEIKKIEIEKGSLKNPIHFNYDGLQLKIKLDRTYLSSENYTLYIEYTSKPDEYQGSGSIAITDAKGLYFINPRGIDKNKPTQIWTQGETESNSVWFPTIDKPNQKSTEEIIMTVPSKYVTLSNGLLISQKNNLDGTRTDDWKMDLPHAPYLFFMGVGEFSIIKDNYKGKEVAYYVEKEYASVAKKIFGETPAMMAYFEKLTGVNFPWPKYDQMVGRDYVSGAMENTSATLHQENAYQNARQLTDGNKWEEDISHELFHQWFGDLVTAESWSNITVNESMADYSESLWDEYRHGKDAADQHLQEHRLSYLGNPADAQKNLVRFNYSDKEDVFDNVSYQKGGSILHMLRNYVGDSAFFKSLNKYLNDNKFKSAEAQNLRLAFEEVTGKDLNWFWNQWYFGNGHPVLDINYSLANGKSTVIIQQLQKSGKIFRLPIAIDIYNGSNKVRYQVLVQNKADTFVFNTPEMPALINVDADKILLAEKNDHKTADNYIHQWKNAGNYIDRMEALEYFSSKNMNQLTEGLNDRFHSLRLYTLRRLGVNTSLLTNEVIHKVEIMSEKDADKLVQAQALELLGRLGNKKYESLFLRLSSDSSYTVAGSALEGLKTLNPSLAKQLARKYSNDTKGKLANIVSSIIQENAGEEDFDFFFNQFKSTLSTQEKIQASINFGEYLANIKNEEKVKMGVNEIMNFRNQTSADVQKFIDGYLKTTFERITKTQRNAGNKSLADYVDGLLK